MLACLCQAASGGRYQGFKARTGTKRGVARLLDSLQRQLHVAGGRRSSRPVSVCVSRVVTPGTSRGRRGGRRRSARPAGAPDRTQLADSLAAAAAGAGLLGRSQQAAASKAAAAAAAVAKEAELPGGGPASQQQVQPQRGAVSGQIKSAARPIVAAAAAGGAPVRRPKPAASPAVNSGGSGTSRAAAAPRQTPAAKPLVREGGGSSSVPSPAGSPIATTKAAAPSVARSPAAVESGPAGMAVVGGSVAQQRAKQAVPAHAARSTPFEPLPPQRPPAAAAGSPAPAALSPRQPTQQQLPAAGQNQRRMPGRPAAEAKPAHPARTAPFNPSRPATPAGEAVPGARPPSLQQLPQQGPAAAGPSRPATAAGASRPATAAAASPGASPARGPPQRSPSRAPRPSPASKPAEKQAHKARTTPFQPGPSRPATAAAPPSPSQPPPTAAPVAAGAAQLLQRALSPMRAAHPAPAGTPRRPATSDTAPGASLAWQPHHASPLRPATSPIAQPSVAAGRPPLPVVAAAAGAAGGCSGGGLPPRSPGPTTAPTSSMGVAAAPSPAAEREGAVPAAHMGVGLVTQESSWTVASEPSTSAGPGSEERRRSAAVAAAGDLGRWLRGAQVQPSTRLVESCLPGGLERDLFMLIMRQRHYVGSKVQVGVEGGEQACWLVCRAGSAAALVGRGCGAVRCRKGHVRLH